MPGIADAGAFLMLHQHAVSVAGTEPGRKAAGMRLNWCVCPRRRIPGEGYRVPITVSSPEPSGYTASLYVITEC